MVVRANHDFSRLPISVIGIVPHRMVRRTVSIEDGQVRISERGLFPWPARTEPLSEFAVRRSAAMRHGSPVFTIDLVNAEGDCIVPLLSSNDEAEARTAWLDLARATGLDTIDDTPVGTVTRRNPALETPFRSLAEAGNLDVPPPQPAEPRWPMRWRAPDTAAGRPPWPQGTTDISLPRVGPAVLTVFALLIGASAFVCWNGIPGGLVAMLEAVRTLYCIQTALLLAFLVLMLGERRHVAVTRRGVTLCATWFGRRRGGITLPLDAVDTVTVPGRRLALGAGSVLIVAAGSSGFAMPGLSAYQAGWIGRFVMAAAAAERWVYEGGVPAPPGPAGADTPAERRPCAA